jgi:hypothetical protein
METRRMTRLLRLLTALAVIVLPSQAQASSITITWTGTARWYNGDWLLGCQQSGLACEFWDGLQSLGIDISGPTSATPLTLSMTFQDAVSDAYGYVNTTADIRFEFGRLSIVSHDRSAFFFDLGVPPGYGFSSGFDPSTAPILAGYDGPPQGIYVGGFGFRTPPNQSLVTTLSQLPLTALSSRYCISLGGDCDVFGAFTATRVLVPEASSIAVLTSGALAWLWFRRVKKPRRRGDIQLSKI